MRILGLTGSIAMGKSTTARMLRRLKVPVHDADDCVHRLFVEGGRAVGPISKAFHGVVKGGAVDRSRLGAQVFGKPDELKSLRRLFTRWFAVTGIGFSRRTAGGGPVLWSWMCRCYSRVVGTAAVMKSWWLAHRVFSSAVGP